MNLINRKNAAKRLQGRAMPKIIDKFATAVEGRTIAFVGYVIEDGNAIPVLVLDNAEVISAWRDDEGNGPGVLRSSTGAILCQTRPADAPHTLPLYEVCEHLVEGYWFVRFKQGDEWNHHSLHGDYAEAVRVCDELNRKGEGTL